MKVINMLSFCKNQTSIRKYCISVSVIFSVDLFFAANVYAQALPADRVPDNVIALKTVKSDETLKLLSTDERIDVFKRFQNAIYTPLETRPSLPFHLTYTAFRKKTDKNGEPLIKFKGQYSVDPSKPKGQRVTILSQSDKTPPGFIKAQLKSWETDEISDNYYCSLDKEIMDEIKSVEDPAQINFKTVPSLPGQISFNFNLPNTVVLSEDKDGNLKAENDPVIAKLIQNSIIETTIDDVTSRPRSLRIFIEEPFSILGVLRVRALDAVLTCNVDTNNALYAKESLFFIRYRSFGIAQREHYLAQIEFLESAP